ncbi:MAG: MOSC domain-containing protein [Deltaproteobacteria bacterium]|nr:MOSC domain-containing protein [Deltaproteobacteria bacterium]
MRRWTIRQLSELVIYPVKSLAGISRPEMTLTSRGIAYDREWMVVDEKGRFLTQRTLPRMALVRTAIEDGALVLSARGRSDLAVPLGGVDGDFVVVKIWLDKTRAVDQGDEAASWFSETLGVRCRLVRAHPDHLRKASRGGAAYAFADAYPLLVISEASLADLNSRLDAPLPMNRFRPNIVVSGTAPYEEDTWTRVRCGETAVRVRKPCVRCAIPTTDQETAERSREPLKTLAVYRSTAAGVTFGVNADYEGAGTISVGDGVELVDG